MFRFTIRELVLVTLVVGLAIGWWMSRSEATALRVERDTLQHAITKAGFEVLEIKPDGPILFFRDDPSTSAP